MKEYHSTLKQIVCQLELEINISHIIKHLEILNINPPWQTSAETTSFYAICIILVRSFLLISIIKKKGQKHDV